MGLKSRLYVYLLGVIALVILATFITYTLLAGKYVKHSVEQQLTDIADLVVQDVVLANMTDDFAHLEQRFKYYAQLDYVERVHWHMGTQNPLDAQNPTTQQVPRWFKGLFDGAQVGFVQPVYWHGASYGELFLEGDSQKLVASLWYFLLYLMVFVVVLSILWLASLDMVMRPILQQIRSLNDDALRIGAGDLHSPVRAGGSAEVLQLSLTMEQMRAALKLSLETQDKNQATLRSVSKENEQRLVWLKNLFNTLPHAVLLEDKDNNIIFTNQLFCDFFKLILTPLELTNNYKAEAVMTDTRIFYTEPAKLLDFMRLSVAENKRQQQLFSMQDGRWVLQDFIPMRDERTRTYVGRLWLYQDVTQKHILEQKLHWQAKHDALTGLYNRAAFEERLQNLPKDGLKEYALLYIDLDQFRLINDTSGHEAGDELLQEVAKELKRIQPAGSMLARMGGDEFAFLIVATDEQAMVFADVILAQLKDFRFVFIERVYQIGASIGVVPDVAQSTDSKMLMAMADAACYAAKNAGRNTAWLYQTSDVYLQKQRDEMQVVADLHIALEDNQFQIYAQRLVPLTREDDQLHLEILLRWQDKDGKLIPPDLFIPAAERYGLMAKIDRWVIENTLTYLCNTPELLNRIAVFGINLSGGSFSQPDLVSFVRDLIERLQFPADKIYFEITETAAVTQLDQANEFILAMKSLGCRFALDDFGAGQSSFMYLKQLPVDYLKIDGSFVKTMLDDHANAALVQGMHSISHALGMKTIAEFVENGDIADALRAINVDYGQGWHFHKAQPIAELLNQP